MKQKGHDIICFGGEDWWYHNQAHIDMQLMKRFARGNTALYVNSIVMQKANLGEGATFVRRLLRKTKSIVTGLRKSETGFWVYSPFTLPIHHLAWGRALHKKMLEYQLRFVMRKLGMKNPIVWVACPAACDVALDMKRTRLVYQRTDRFEEYPNTSVEAVREYDRALKAHADLTVFVSSTLYDEEAGQCKKAIYLDHGVDFDMFASAAGNNGHPEEMRRISKPIVGFFGDIEDHLLDMELVERVVDLLPRMSFVFVGKRLTDFSKLDSRENVWFLGQKPYEQIPHYGKGFDVAVMPWRQSRWIEACNPIKLKEYLALGKPVVSTPFAELQKYLDVVYQARTAEEFARCIELALAEDGPERIAARRKKVQPFTWDAKADFVLKTLFDETDAFRGAD
ncbi:MAG TPA: glycosyltransferase [Sedimentisphaerales bacterium]|nr:glycosyltransferase [Sedimentisphaerales bacterium]